MFIVILTEPEFVLIVNVFDQWLPLGCLERKHLFTCRAASLTSSGHLPVL